MLGSLSWTKRIKREGLQGFSYGVEPNIITAGQLVPEKDINAIYFYPELLKLNVDQREEFICILHVHHGDRKMRNKEVDIALNVVLAMMSTLLVNIIWNDKNTLSDINKLVTNPRYLPIKEHLTGNVVHLIRGQGVREENDIQLEESSSLHDNAGLVKLTFQQYSAVNNLMKAISTFQNVNQVQATLSNILERFKETIKIINLCNGFDTPVPLSVLETSNVTVCKLETKSAEKYAPENEKLPKRRSELRHENVRMPKEIEEKIRSFFSRQLSEQINSEIDHWINNDLINQNFVPIQNEFGSSLQYFNEQNITRLLFEAKEKFQENQKLINEEILECMQNFYMIMNTQFEDVPHFGGNALRKTLNVTLTSVTSDLKFPESKERIMKASRNMFKVYYEQSKVRNSVIKQPDLFNDVVKIISEGESLHGDKPLRDAVYIGEGSNSGRKSGKKRSEPFSPHHQRPNNTSKLTNISSPSSRVSLQQNCSQNDLKSLIIQSEAFGDSDNKVTYDDEVLDDTTSKRRTPQASSSFGEKTNSAEKIGEMRWSTFDHRYGRPNNTNKLNSIHTENERRPTTKLQVDILNEDKQSYQEPIAKNIKEELPPLLFQIMLRKVGIATLPINSWETNSTPISINSHSGEVGVLFSGNWVCGDDVKELIQRGKVQKFWSFEAIFNTIEFYDEVVINMEPIHITLPFLLGIFFQILKQKAENQHDGKFKTAIISVPFWFSSNKRRHIMEAGTIAGFENVQLISENTASAYYAYTSGLSSPNENMVVISENSNRVDISIYSYDQRSKIIHMRGQSGDYETAELSGDKMFLKKIVTGTLAYYFSNQQERGIKEKALQSLDKFWSLAKSRVKDRLSHVNRTVLICCESDHWREFLWKFAEKITTPEYISIRNDSPLLGLGSFFQSSVSSKNGSVESLFKDAIPFNVTLTNGNQNFPFLIKNSTFSNVVTRELHLHLELPKSIDYLSFNEEGLALERFGTFYLKSKPPDLFNIKATLGWTRNGIFKLNGVDYAEGGSYEWVGPRKPLPAYCYEWQPSKTTDETIATYRSLMDQIILQTKSPDEVEDMLKPTEEKAKKIKEAIQACTDKFKSSLGKKLVIRQIDEIIEALKQPGIQVKLLNKHATYLDSIVQKYDLQI